MKFQYRAFDRAGKAAVASVEAPTLAEAGELLRRQGLFVTEIAPAKGESQSGGGHEGSVRGRVKGGRLKVLSAFMRHLSVLVSTGTPVVDGLQALEDQCKDPVWKAVLADIRKRVEEGAPFSEALAAHPHHFDSVCRSLVRAGESGGRLDVMLVRLAELTRRQHKVRQTLVGSMAYPCLLIGVSVAVLLVMLLFVMPRFTGLFETLDMPLPPTTKALMAASGFLVEYWWGVLIVVLGAGSGAAVWLRTDHGRRARDTFAVRAPQIGRVARSFATARFARVMGLLLDSKVPMLESLELTRQSIANIHFVELLTRAEDVLTRGESLSVAVGAGGLIDPAVCQAVRNGERTGQLGPVLTSMADFLDEENEVLVKSLTSLVEPLILITLGLIVGLVATSMFLPLFDLTAMAGGAPPGAGGTP